jgi:transposase
MRPSFSEGGVRSPAPPGYESDVGAVKALAWSAVDGCEFRDSIEAMWNDHAASTRAVPGPMLTAKRG